jgi:glycosyltransferase involved in cell wall biosynthesis
VVLHFARWLRAAHPEVGVDVLALKGGPLAEEFRKVADQYVELVMPPLPERSLASRAGLRLLRMLGFARVPTSAEWKEMQLAQLADRCYDVVLANSLASIPVAGQIKALAPEKPIVISFIHELEMVIRQLLPELLQHLRPVDRIWAGSALVRDGLIRQWGVPEERIDVQYPIAQVQGSSDVLTNTRHTGTIHVVGLGSVVLRKGYDLFIQVALWVKRHHPEVPVRFSWGGPVAHYDRPLIDHDLKHAGLEDIVDFIGEVVDPGALYRELDVFLLPSREDPFPLVCIEAGAMGKPIVCFEGATGTAEVLRNGGGMIVPYLDVEAMGRAVVDYARDPERRRKDGELNRVQFANFGPDQQCPLMWERITAAWKEKASKR